MNKFNIGDQVKVVKFGVNASRFFNRAVHSNESGVYQFKDWINLVFEVCEDPKLFRALNRVDDELCYPVSFEGKEIGYVYESGLEKVEPKQMQPNLKIKKAILLLTGGTDVIKLTIDAPSSFPDMGYDTTITMECKQGYGETYCKEILGLNPEIISLRTK